MAGIPQCALIRDGFGEEIEYTRVELTEKGNLATQEVLAAAIASCPMPAITGCECPFLVPVPAAEV